MKIDWNKIKNDISVIELEQFIAQNKKILSIKQLLQLNVECNRQLNNCHKLAEAFVYSYLYKLAEKISEKGNLLHVLNNMVRIRKGLLLQQLGKRRANKRWGAR